MSLQLERRCPLFLQNLLHLLETSIYIFLCELVFRRLIYQGHSKGGAQGCSWFNLKQNQGPRKIHQYSLLKRINHYYYKKYFPGIEGQNKRTVVIFWSSFFNIIN